MRTPLQRAVSALKAGVARTPDDVAARLVYADALEEAGRLPEAARQRRLAQAVARPASVLLSPVRRRQILRLAGESRCPVVVVAGEGAPEATGERAYHTFRDSDRVCHHPGAALRKGYKVDYHHSTRQVRVGVLWLIRNKFIR